MSPPNGYSSADEALSYATPEQTASIQVTNVWLPEYLEESSKRVATTYTVCHAGARLHLEGIWSSHLSYLVCVRSSDRSSCASLVGARAFESVNKAAHENLCMLDGWRLVLCHKRLIA